MILWSSCILPVLCDFLHVCGGDPAKGNRDFLMLRFSPRMWRWSYMFYLIEPRQSIFSTYVEVILSFIRRMVMKQDFLHVCGGDPRINNWWVCWFCIFSTYVEVILRNLKLKVRLSDFLHVCGGDPGRWSRRCMNLEFSPRMWRWSCISSIKVSKPQIFSTYVEVILLIVTWFKNVILFSPRMWRWSSWWMV